MQLQPGESATCGNCGKVILGPGAWGINPTAVCGCSQRTLIRNPAVDAAPPAGLAGFHGTLTIGPMTPRDVMVDSLRRALQKIADLPTGPSKTKRGDPRLRARRIAVAALKSSAMKERSWLSRAQ
jgi:hypothetical protein